MLKFIDKLLIRPIMCLILRNIKQKEYYDKPLYVRNEEYIEDIKLLRSAIKISDPKYLINIKDIDDLIKKIGYLPMVRWAVGSSLEYHVYNVFDRERNEIINFISFLILI